MANIIIGTMYLFVLRTKSYWASVSVPGYDFENNLRKTPGFENRRTIVLFEGDCCLCFSLCPAEMAAQCTAASNDSHPSSVTSCPACSVYKKTHCT